MNIDPDPAKASSTERVKTAVSEVMAYDIDGIHFDDYFYNAKTGYKDVSGAITVQGGQDHPRNEKKSYVNTMVRAVYREVKAKRRRWISASALRGLQKTAGFPARILIRGCHKKGCGRI